MKFFLASKTIPQEIAADFFVTVGKPKDKIRFALIENAADMYSDGDKSFVYDFRDSLDELGIRYEPIDLRDFFNTDDIVSRLKHCDVVWFGGGNVFYLRSILKESGLDERMPELLEKGIIYGGGSAGAIVAGPTLEYFDLMDDPADTPEIIKEGLGLVDIVVLPHWKNEKYQSKLETIKKNLDAKGIQTVPITDNQAVVYQTSHNH